MTIVTQTIIACIAIFVGLFVLGLQAFTLSYGEQPFLSGHLGFGLTLSGGLLMLGGGLFMPGSDE
jgi:hypothetical protein